MDQWVAPRRVVRFGVRLVVALCLGLGLVYPQLLHATLGQNSHSIEADRDHLHGVVASENKGDYTVYTIVYGYNDQEQLNEYVSSDDVVFAVAWTGVRTPDLSKILDSKYEEYQVQRMINQSNSKRLRGPASRTESAGIVVVTSGHMRSVFQGRAFDPTLLNQLGVNESEIK